MTKKVIVVMMIIGMTVAVKASAPPCVTLAWDPNSEPEVIGYSIYILDENNFYIWYDDIDETELNDPLYPQWTICGLEPLPTRHFAVTAYTADKESDYSLTVCAELLPDSENYTECGYYGIPVEDNCDNDDIVRIDSLCPPKPTVQPTKNDDKKNSGGGGCFISSLM